MEERISLSVLIDCERDSAEAAEALTSSLQQSFMQDQNVISAGPLKDESQSQQGTKSITLAAVLGGLKLLIGSHAASAVIGQIWHSVQGRPITVELQKNGAKLKVTVRNAEELAHVMDSVNRFATT